MDRSIKMGDQSSIPTGAPAEISEKEFPSQTYAVSGKTLGMFVNEEGSGTVPRMCPKCVLYSPFQSHTRGIGVRMWLI